MAGIPLAISPTQRSPGVGLLINLTAGAASPGTGALRGLMISPKASAGLIATNTLLQGLAGEGAAATQLGQGSPGHLAAKAIFAELPRAAIDLISPPASSGVVATQTIVFKDSNNSGSDVTVAQTVDVYIAGRLIEIAWLVGETAIQAATKFVTAVNALGYDLPCIAANGSGTLATVTLTASFAGLWGNDISLFGALSGGTGGVLTVTGALFTGGTLEMNIATSLSAVANQEYDFILLVTSNADVISTSTTSNPGRLKTHINTYGSGQPALLQQGILGCTGALSSLKSSTAVLNFAQLEIVECRNGQSLPCEWAAAEMGARLRERALFPVKNRIQMAYKATLYVPHALVTDAFSAVELEDALQHGITPVVFDATHNPSPYRPITTYWQDSNANADDRVLDVTRVDGIYTVAKDLRIALPQQFPGKSLSPDLPDGDDSLPPDVVEIRDIRAFIIGRLRVWQGRGVLRRDKLDEAIGTRNAPGTLLVQIDAIDDSQVDCFIPLATIPPLAKFSLYVTQAA